VTTFYTMKQEEEEEEREVIVLSGDVRVARWWNRLRVGLARNQQVAD